MRKELSLVDNTQALHLLEDQKVELLNRLKLMRQRHLLVTILRHSHRLNVLCLGGIPRNFKISFLSLNCHF